MEKMKTAVIAGATGLIGKQLMYKLLESTFYQKVIVLVRKEIPIKHSKIEQQILDFDNIAHFQEQLQGDDFFCCLGTTMKKAGSKEAFYKVDFIYCLELAKIASQNHYKSFNLVSAIGSDTNSSIYYSKVKGQLEKTLEELNIAQLNIFQPSILVGNRAEFRLGERIGIGIAQLIAPLLIGGLRKYNPIHAAQVANAMLNAAQNEAIERVARYEFEQMMELQ
jgi:uncharacterized protein YbjT (DUF2867 family)